jgi:hypothetical protein
MKKWLGLLLCAATLCVNGCNTSPTRMASPTSTTSPTPALTLTPITFSKIDRWPAPANYHRGSLTSIPTYDPNSDDPFQMDLRAYNLSGLDLSGSLNDLLYATFDDQTIWPPADRLPEGFDWVHILELGKNPGLGVRSLHAQGITGRGVSIAIVDQPLLIEHQEYANRFQLYEEINIDPTTTSQMHGPTVASIAAGRTVGVAPESSLYYIATWVGDWTDKGLERHFRYHAQGVRRILEINEQLPETQKIRVISMQVRWKPEDAGYDEITAAVDDAKAAGMLVVCSSIEQVHGFKFHGLGRAPLSDPEAFESYEPGSWWAEEFYNGERFSDRLLVPMDSRTTASPLGDDEYVFYRQGGWSWSIPYIAGMYALAVQVDPAITPEQFWSLAMQTGRTIELDHNGETIALGPIIDPVALIRALQS